MSRLVIAVILVCALLSAAAARAHPKNTTCAAQTGNSTQSCADCAALSGCFWIGNLSLCVTQAEAVTAYAGYTQCSGEPCHLICAGKPCSKGFWPCSESVTGELLLMAIYGVILAYGATLISDGSELLLEVLDPGIIGGLLLPVLGAVPDSAIVLMSGAFGAHNVAEAQVAVGVGTLAGSTIMLLTLPWAVGLFLGRCDLVHGQALDGRLTHTWSLTRTGVSVDENTPVNARIMLGTALCYMIVQSVAFFKLAAPSAESAIKLERPFAFAGFAVCMVALIAYCIYQVVNPKLQEKKIAEAKKRHMADMFVKNMLHLQARAQARAADAAERAAAAERGETERTALLSSAAGAADLGHPEPVDVRAVGLKWKKKAAEKAAAAQAVDSGAPGIQTKKEDEEEEPSGDADWRIIVPKAVAILMLGTAVVSVFSDPMVTVINDFGVTIGVPAFFVSFLVTPFCSNASEVISSLIFLSRKKRVNASLSYAQLYGAATMNNTMVLGIFYALIAFRGLAWTYTAETASILLVTLLVGIVAAFKKTYELYWAIPVLSLYPLSLVFVWILEYPVGLT